MTPRTINLRFCSISSDGYKTTVRFVDGSTCDAVPHDTPHYHVIAHRCGYGDDLSAYCFEHEFFHAFCEERLHNRPSPVLQHVAWGKMLSGQAAAAEEIVAQAAQRWVRANERPIVGGVDWDAFKRDALLLLDGDSVPA